ncbi:putative pectinesterase/pectinesterase inhibitor 28 [Drosera capensis]
MEGEINPTSYKETCEKSLQSAAGNTTDPKELIMLAFKLAKEEVSSALSKSATIKAVANDPRAKQGLEICHEVIEDAVEDLENSLESFGNFSFSNMDDFLEDLKVWIGGAATSQDVCFDAFENATSDAGEKMRDLFNASRQLTSNALTMVSEVKSILSTLNIPGLLGGRRLLAKTQVMPQAGHLPPWINDAKRNLMKAPLASIKPDVVVAKDGSGRVKTINEALALVPKKNTKPFIIYIKAGVYNEQVTVDKKMTDVIFIGDGPTKTKITGNKNFADGTQTFKTATVAVMALGFMARDIGFENSAGPTKHQAVAIRVVGDFSVFYNCRFDGYQDTLYAVRSRQFYRDCTITGTIDFIFGDAQVVFQNCKIIIRKPLENQQCMVTAQGRTEPKGPGATILQNCAIVADPAYYPVRMKNKAFLGRPWKQYSRTIVMQSFLEDSIAPEGWTPWAGTFGLNTLFYAEHDNRGPGAVQSNRVKWAGIKKLTPQQIQGFTPEKFFKGSQWITMTGAPYNAGLIRV